LATVFSKGALARQESPSLSGPFVTFARVVVLAWVMW
jgi:hypothetical protein